MTRALGVFLLALAMVACRDSTAPITTPCDEQKALELQGLEATGIPVDSILTVHAPPNHWFEIHYRTPAGYGVAVLQWTDGDPVLCAVSYGEGGGTKGGG